MTKDEFDREAEFHKTLEDSVNRLKDLKGEWQFGDIPLDHDYWRAQNVHNALYGGANPPFVETSKVETETDKKS